MSLQDRLAEAMDCPDVGTLAEFANRLQPLPHLFGRLVGEGEREDARADFPRLDQIAHPLCEDASLPGAGRGHHEEMPVLRLDDTLLFVGALHASDAATDVERSPASARSSA